MITTKERTAAAKAEAAFFDWMQKKRIAEKGGLTIESCDEQGTIEIWKMYKPHLNFTTSRDERIIMG